MIGAIRESLYSLSTLEPDLTLNVEPFDSLRAGS